MKPQHTKAVIQCAPDKAALLSSRNYYTIEHESDGIVTRFIDCKPYYRRTSNDGSVKVFLRYPITRSAVIREAGNFPCPA